MYIAIDKTYRPHPPPIGGGPGDDFPPPPPLFPTRPMRLPLSALHGINDIIIQYNMAGQLSVT